MDVVISLIKILCSGIFFCVGMCQNAIPGALFQKDASWNNIPKPFFIASAL
jgi:hypothetical protein